MNDLKKYFIGLDHVTYLYSGAESPSLASNVEMLTNYLRDKSLGEYGRKKANEIEMKAKKNIAQLINASYDEIAFTANASEAINTLVESLKIKPGDNVILNDLEYPSMVLPWIKLKNEMQIEIRLIHSQKRVVDPKKINELMDERTCLVAVSHVSYLNGFRHNLKVLREITKQKNVPLLVDATQSLGVVPVNSEYFDMMVSSSYKWLLGTHGLGILYVDKGFQRNLEPQRIGWRSVKTIFSDDRFESYELKDDAGQFEVGFNNYPAIYALKNSTDFLLHVNINKIEAHVLDLGEILIEELNKQGWPLLSPSKKEERSGNISIVADNSVDLMNELEKQNIKVWGGDGRVRFSIHLFNTYEDIIRLLKALAPYSKKY